MANKLDFYVIIMMISSEFRFTRPGLTLSAGVPSTSCSIPETNANCKRYHRRVIMCRPSGEFNIYLHRIADSDPIWTSHQKERWGLEESERQRE